MIFENEKLYVEIEKSNIPWLKIYMKAKYKEISELNREDRIMLMDMTNIVEKALVSYYNPEKINIASFGNMLPEVHIHIMARYKEDGYFPNPMWGDKTLDTNFSIEIDKEFISILREDLNKC